MSFLVHATEGRIAARAYCGMWIADCLRCQNAERLDRFQPMALCSYCEVRIEVIWPSEEMTHSIERLLLMRPLPYTQNWNPGEALTDLVEENAVHGVFDGLKPVAERFAGLELLAVVGEKITVDQLPVTKRRDMQQIGT